MQIAPINRFIPFSNVDGPGNRMAIFVQSCQFKCLYCHNPETINMCVHCGSCVDSCPVQALSMVDGKVVWDKEKCVKCDTCLKVCPNLSSPKVRYMSVDEVFAKIMEVRPFIKGITISGGECTTYPEFITELFKKAHEVGLSCFLDSNGCFDYTTMEELLNETDKVMLDVKAFDKEYHKTITSKDNEVVLNNLKYLLEHDKCYEVRTVLLNDAKQNEITVSNVAKIITDKCIYKLIKYRPFGVREEGLKILGNSIVSDEELNRMKQIALENGATKVTIV